MFPPKHAVAKYLLYWLVFPLGQSHAKSSGLVGTNTNKVLMPTAYFLLLAHMIYHASVLYHYMYHCIVKDFIILVN